MSIPTGSAGYLLAGQASELERLQLQSRVWEPSGRRLLEEIGDGRGSRALDVGCGVLGWLRVLSEWGRLGRGATAPRPAARVGIEGNVGAEVLALPQGASLPAPAVQFATSLEERLMSLVTADELAELRKEGEAELQEPGRWGTTFTLLQCWGRCPA